LQNVQLVDDLKYRNKITDSLRLTVHKVVKNSDTAMQNLYVTKGLSDLFL